MIALYHASNIWAVFSISLHPAQTTVGGRKKEKANDELQAGQAGGEAPYQSPWGKNKTLDIEQLNNFGDFILGLFYEGKTQALKLQW